MPADSLRSALGAARELLLALPTTTRVALLDAARPSARGPVFRTRARALAELGALPAGAVRPAYATWLDRLPAKAPGGLPVSAVYFGQASAPVVTNVATVDRLQLAGTFVNAAVLGKPPLGYLANAPARTGGRLISLTSASEFLSAADTMSSDYLGSYQVQLTSGLSGAALGPVTVRVSNLASVVTGEPGAVGAAQAQPEHAPTARSSGGNVFTTGWPYVAIAAAGSAAAAAFWRRRSTRRIVAT